MARILAAIVLAIAGAIPFSAGALGLGEIDLKSALNQPFSAEIPVVSEAPGDLKALRVEIAPAETFKQFGLDRPAFLSNFSFTVVGGESENTAAVQISSQQVVVEPFVTLLLEVSWPQGRLLREYTVLLDPPVYATESVAAAVTAPTAGPSATTGSEVTANEGSEKQFEPAPSSVTKTPVTRTAQPDQQATAVGSAGGAPSGASQPAIAGNEGAGSESIYGPVKRKETLWEIAGGAIGDSSSVSRNQMMLAIFQANPEAFNGNINRLKAGMILRVPSVGEVALGSSDATAEVRRQNEQWRSETARRKELQGGRLRLVPPPDSDSDSGSVDQAARSDSTGEDQPATDTANRDALQGRVSELESQLDESQRQLQIRDQELEALQRQLAELSSQRQDAPLTDVSEFPADVVVPESAPESAPESTIQEQPGEDSAAPVVDTETAGEDAPAPIDVTPVQKEPAEESFLGALFANPLVYISLAIVLLLAWLFARKRSAADEDEETGRWDALDEADDIQADDIQADDIQERHEATTRLEAQPLQDENFVVEEAAPSPGEATDDGEGVSPFADDSSDDWGGLVDETETPLERTISTDSAVNLDQADPIAESDFHMAYGLYDQAADLLTKSIEIEPERKDLRMKLLEVFFIWENQDGFLREAQALQQQLDDAADPDWNKVLIMGKQICPDEALFAGEAASGGLSENVDLEFGDDGGSESIDFALDDDSASSVDLEFEDAGESLDFDLTGDQDSSDDSDAGMLDFEIGSEDEATQLADDDLEFSGDALTVESPEMDSTMESPTIESSAMDSTMESPTIESPAMDSTMESPTIESPAMDSTLETPTIESPIGEWGDDNDDGSAEAGSEQTAEIELADLDLDLSGLDDISEDSLIDEAPLIDDETAADMPPSDELGDEPGDDTPGDDTKEQPAASLDDISGEGVESLQDLADDVESTAEMRNLEEPQIGDTVEQPFAGGGDTAEQPDLAALADDDLMLDVGEPVIDDEPTAEIVDGGSGVDGATMNEVGTKLDLARAYIDMGDPDGARSILNEVLEEADSEQKQEAQKLLDDLVD